MKKYLWYAVLCGVMLMIMPALISLLQVVELSDFIDQLYILIDQSLSIIVWHGLIFGGLFYGLLHYFKSEKNRKKIEALNETIVSWLALIFLLVVLLCDVIFFVS